MMSRTSGFADSGTYQLLSNSFRSLCAEQMRHLEEEGELALPLVEDLHEAVRGGCTPEQRRILIDLKRAVFNGRRLDPLPDWVSGSLRTRLEQLDQMRSCIDNGSSEIEEQIVSELEHSAIRVLSEPNFSLAISYAAPGLQERLHKKSARLNLRLKTLNAVYSYCQKATTKAPALHMFGRLSFPPASGEVGEECYEIVCRSSFLLEAETALLRDVAPLYGTASLSVLPFVRTAQGLSFLSVTRSGMNWISVPATELLVYVVSVLQDHCGAPARDAVQAIARCCDVEEALAGKWLSELVGAGLVRLYLAGGPEFGFPESVPEIPGASHRTELISMHGVMMLADDFYSMCRKSQAVASAMQKDAFIYRYKPVESPDWLNMAATFREDLSPLGRLLAQTPSYGDLRTRVRSVLFGRLRGVQSVVPLLEWIRMMRHRDVDEASANRGSTITGPALGKLSGELDLPALGKWRGATDQDICVLGAIDASEPWFFPHNLYHCTARYLSKYRIRKARNDEPAAAQSDTLEVEVVGPIETPHSLARPTLQWGFSYDTRHRNRFTHWLDAADVELRPSQNGWHFHQASSGKRIRFAYFGLSLFRDLPVPYQALLIDQPDTYDNPFDSLPIQFAGQASIHVEGLRYRSIYLRRPCWVISSQAVAEMLKPEGFVASAIHAARRIRQMTGIEDELYFRLHNGTSIVDRPHRIDLRTPLGWFYLKRYLNKFTETPNLHVTLPSPGRAQHPMVDGEPAFTELMVRSGGQ